eukprot:TRINITY_DN24205_c0_g1_i1.p1 TRINITY_DN24205_c0_g1~~TRINITY_DN24205_c0_g1_i1.p1  ORF type:complete len:521 (+),score=108.36 TRINITY_DN24205_c0_g1_i1:73-1635(+)
MDNIDCSLANPKLEDQLLDRFDDATKGLTFDDEGDYGSNASVLQTMMKKQYCNVDALNEDGMKRFFASHRVLTRRMSKQIGSLSVRFTVQYNLFSGTVNALGSPDQVEWLKKSHDNGELGCFLLTEKAAGVLSGLIVETTAEYTKEGFLINTPNDNAIKVWISQGLLAKWGVVIAKLIIDGTDHGIHGFIVDMADKNIIKEDMGAKTAYNSLDNANITFKNVLIPHKSMLTKFARVTESGKFEFEGDRPPSFIKIAQRLLSGRLCIADSAVQFFRECIRTTQTYTDTRKVWVEPTKQLTISELPYVKQVFNEANQCASVHAKYLLHLQTEFAKTAQAGSEPSRKLQNLIAAAKAEAVDFATTWLSKVRCKVGSYSLMKESPFGTSSDILYCMRFAEGDTHILQQSLVREVIKEKTTPFGFVSLLLQVFKGFLISYTGMMSPAAKLTYKMNLAILSLLVYMKMNTRRLGRIGAWYAAGERVYNVAKLVSLNMIYSTVVSKYGHSAETAQFARVSLRDCAAL